MKNLILLTIAVLTQSLAPLYGQTTFEDTTVVCVRTQNNLIYVEKEIVYKTVQCKDSEIVCATDKNTRYITEIYKIDPLIKDFAKSYNKEELSDLYNNGHFTQFLDRRYDEWEKPSNHGHFLAYFKKFHEYYPVVNKKNGTIDAGIERGSKIFPNVILFSFILISLMVIFSLKENRLRSLYISKPHIYNKKFNNSETLTEWKNMGYLFWSNLYGTISILMPLAAYYFIQNDFIRSEIINDWPFYAMCFITLILRNIRPTREGILNHAGLHMLEFIILINFFLFCVQDFKINNLSLSGSIPILGYYLIIISITFTITALRFYRHIYNQSIWTTIGVNQVLWFIASKYEKIRHIKTFNNK